MARLAIAVACLLLLIPRSARALSREEFLRSGVRNFVEQLADAAADHPAAERDSVMQTTSKRWHEKNPYLGRVTARSATIADTTWIIAQDASYGAAAALVATGTSVVMPIVLRWSDDIHLHGLLDMVAWSDTISGDRRWQFVATYRTNYRRNSTAVRWLAWEPDSSRLIELGRLPVTVDSARVRPIAHVGGAIVDAWWQTTGLIPTVLRTPPAGVPRMRFMGRYWFLGDTVVIADRHVVCDEFGALVAVVGRSQGDAANCLSECMVSPAADSALRRLGPSPSMWKRGTPVDGGTLYTLYGRPGEPPLRLTVKRERAAGERWRIDVAR